MNESQKQSKIHIEPYSILRDVIRNLWVIVLAALIGLMSVSIWNDSMYTPSYTSTATLLVNLRNSAAYSYTNLSSSSEMARIFTEVFVQPTMKAYAADHLGMDSFVGSVSAKVLDETNIFTVSVTTSSPETSYEELCAILEIYPQISESVFSDAVIEIMRSPNLPVSPSNSISSRNQKLAVAGCAALVLALVVYLSFLRDTVKDEKTFRDNIDGKLFGVVGHERQHMQLVEILRRKKASLLISDAYASFRFTENFHKLATKLEYLRRNNGAKIFLVTSLAENEGKSTTAANIALALASRNNKVALLDMDFKKPALHKVFDMQGEDLMDLATLISGQATLDTYQFCSYRQSELDLALNKKSYNNYVEWIYTDKMAGIFEQLRQSEKYDFIIVDTPPLSVAADVTGIVHLSDVSMLVVRTDYVYTAAINDAVLSLSEKSNFAGCILNDVHREFSMLGQMGYDENGYGGGYYYRGKRNRYNRYGGYESYSQNTEYKDAHEETPPSDE
jgi:capsular exopolysaccharide synthesis family protein